MHCIILQCNISALDQPNAARGRGHTSRTGSGTVTGEEPRATPEGVAIAVHRCRVEAEKGRRELGYEHDSLHETVLERYAFLCEKHFARHLGSEAVF